MKTIGPHNLASTFLVLDDMTGAIPRSVSPTLYQELDRDFRGFAGHRLVSWYTFTEDWPTWEIHPAGEELVCLLTGIVTLVLEEAQGEREVKLREPGEYVVIPRGTWHTARTRGCTMLFITPGEGTENRSI